MNCTSAMPLPPSKPDRFASRGGVECGRLRAAKSNEARDACDVRTSWTTSNGKDPSVISTDSMRDPCPESTGERMAPQVRPVISAGCAALVAVPAELESRLREAVARCAASLGESPERCRRAVEIAVLQRGLDAMEVGR